MNIHVVSTSDISIERMSKVKGHLTRENGPMSFYFDRIENDTSKVEGTLSLEDLFDISISYRRSKKIPEDEFVITLTDLRNEGSYFASIHPGSLRDGFVHADVNEWKTYIECDASLPAAYMVINLAIVASMVGRFEEIRPATHRSPIGCLNDFCSYKNDVVFKLRTADICRTCIDKLRKVGISDLMIDQTIRIISGIRGQLLNIMYFHGNAQQSRVAIRLDGRRNRIKLLDYQEKIVELTPLQMALYLLFLHYEDGIKLKDLWNYYHDARILNILTSGEAEANFESERVDALRNALRRSDQIREIYEKSTGDWNFTKIKAAFKSQIGMNLVEPYIIKKLDNGYNGITLPRYKVVSVTLPSGNEMDFKDFASVIQWKGMVSI